MADFNWDDMEEEKAAPASKEAEFNWDAMEEDTSLPTDAEGSFDVEAMDQSQKEELFSRGFNPFGGLPETPEQLERKEAADVGALQGLSFGFSDEVQAGMKALGGDDYKESLADIRAKEAEIVEKQPGVAQGMEMAGGIASGIATGGVIGGATKGLGKSLLARSAAGATEGAGLGGLFRAGKSEAETLPELVEDVGEGMKEGAMFGGGLPMAGAVAKKGLQAGKSLIKGAGKVGQWAGEKLPLINIKKETDPGLVYKMAKEGKKLSDPSVRKGLMAKESSGIKDFVSKIDDSRKEIGAKMQKAAEAADDQGIAVDSQALRAKYDDLFDTAIGDQHKNIIETKLGKYLQGGEVKPTDLVKYKQEVGKLGSVYNRKVKMGTAGPDEVDMANKLNEVYADLADNHLSNIPGLNDLSKSYSKVKYMLDEMGGMQKTPGMGIETTSKASRFVKDLDEAVDPAKLDRFSKMKQALEDTAGPASAEQDLTKLKDFSTMRKLVKQFDQADDQGVTSIPEVAGSMVKATKDVAKRLSSPITKSVNSIKDTNSLNSMISMANEGGYRQLANSLKSLEGANPNTIATTLYALKSDPVYRQQLKDIEKKMEGGSNE